MSSIGAEILKGNTREYIYIFIYISPSEHIHAVNLILHDYLFMPQLF